MTGPNDQPESELDAPDSSPPDDRKSETVSATDSETEPAELTPEEQMALYEESLKDTDWGHQPC